MKSEHMCGKMPLLRPWKREVKVFALGMVTGRFTGKPWLLFWHLTSKTTLTKEKNLTDLRWTARTQAHCCNNSDAYWHLLVTDTPVRHSHTSCSPPSEQTHDWHPQNNISKFISSHNIVTIKKKSVQLLLLHSNNFIHYYQLDTLWVAGPPTAVSGVFLNTQRA